MRPTYRFRPLVTAAFLAAMLSGCGGGSSNTMTDDDTMTGGTDTGMTDMQSGDTFLNAALDRDGTNNVVQPGTSAVTAIEENNAGGHDVTYVIDGVDHVVNFTSNERSDNDGWTEYELADYGIWDETGMFFGNSDFAHFDANGWFTCMDSICGRGYVVHGTPTETLPTGTASYSGWSVWRSWPADEPSNQRQTRYWSLMTLTAEFDNRSVDAMFHTWETRVPGESSYESADANTVVTTQNGMFTNTGFTADFVGAGDAARFAGSINGQFFGPDASEVGGTGHGMNGSDVLIGWFGGEVDQ